MKARGFYQTPLAANAEIAAIDPGTSKQGLGLAVARRERIVGVWVVEGWMPVGMPPAFADVVYIEHMQYRAERTHNAQSLIDVSADAGAFAGRVAGPCGAVVRTPVATWKRNLPKAIHHERVTKILDAEELFVLGRALNEIPAGSHSEALDAVGICLYALGRMDAAGKPTKGIPR